MNQVDQDSSKENPVDSSALNVRQPSSKFLRLHIEYVRSQLQNQNLQVEEQHQIEPKRTSPSLDCAPLPSRHEAYQKTQ